MTWLGTTRQDLTNVNKTWFRSSGNRHLMTYGFGWMKIRLTVSYSIMSTKRCTWHTLFVIVSQFAWVDTNCHHVHLRSDFYQSVDGCVPIFLRYWTVRLRRNNNRSLSHVHLSWVHMSDNKILICIFRKNYQGDNTDGITSTRTKPLETALII